MKLNEDFTNLYKRWSEGKKRKEDGVEVETKLGKLMLKNPHCNYEGLIEDILRNRENYPGVIIDSIRGYSTDEIKNIYNGLDYKILIDRGGHGRDLVALFDEYESDDDFGISDDFCEDDYKSICKLIAKSLSETNIEKPKGSTEDYVLYLGDAADVDEFFYDDFKSEFEYEFSLSNDLKFWSYQYDESIGIEISYDSLVNYKKMVEFTENQIESHKQSDE